MQIQRIHTPGDSTDPIGQGKLGSSVNSPGQRALLGLAGGQNEASGQQFEGSQTSVTKDYFELNPVFYYCYRIFPFERGHGTFVANSIRRFLLYEIPTIAITSVLIHSLPSTPLNASSDDLELDSKNKNLDSLEGLRPDPSKVQSKSAWTLEGSGIIGQDQSAQLTASLDLRPGRSKAAGILQDSSASQQKRKASNAVAPPKKKKVTKKALKEKAEALFSYTVKNPFQFLHDLKANVETEEVSSVTEFTTIPFVRESFVEILLNLKACVFENTFAFDEAPGERSSKVLKGKLILNASQESLDDPKEISRSKELFFQKEKPVQNFDDGRTRSTDAERSAGTFGQPSQGRLVREYKIWAKDLILPPGLEVRNPDLVLATLVAPKTNCELEFSLEKIFQLDLTTLSMKTGQHPHRAEEKRRNIPIDGTLFPIKKVNFALSYTKFQKEIITFEIWTNGAVNPRKAIFQSVENILALFQNLREPQMGEISPFEETALDEFESTNL